MSNAIKFSKMGSEIIISCQIVQKIDKIKVLSEFTGAKSLDEKVLQNEQDILIVSVID